MASEYNPSEIDTITQHVNKLTASSVFAQAERLVSFLRYIVGETLKNDGKQINQYVLAMELYNRDESFDPATDSVVRVDAGRLRTKLREYYDTEGKNDDVRFELPKGNYVVKIILGSIVSSEVSTATVTDELPSPLGTKTAGRTRISEGQCTPGVSKIRIQCNGSFELFDSTVYTLSSELIVQGKTSKVSIIGWSFPRPIATVNL